MELEAPAGIPEVSAEFAARRSESAEVREVAEELAVVGVEVAEETVGELAGEPGVEQVADQSAEFAVESAEDLEVAHRG